MHRLQKTMAKHLKLKVSNVISSFQLCRSKNASACVETPVPAICRLSPFNPKAVDINFPKLPAPSPPPSTPENPSSKPNKSWKMTPVRCGCRSSCSFDISDWSIELQDLSWRKETKEKPKPRRSRFYGETSDSKKSRKKQNKKKEKRRTFVASNGWFGSEFEAKGNDIHDQESESLLFSSRSFSYDSSCEFSYTVESTTEKSDDDNSQTSCPIKAKAISNPKRTRKHRRQVSWIGLKAKMAPTPEFPSPVMGSFAEQMISSSTDGKVKEGVAVVKKSEDPHHDFKRSMLEMILEKQIFEPEGLEELLQCFLSLNSRQYQGVIVQVFTEIWELLFCDTPFR